MHCYSVQLLNMQYWFYSTVLEEWGIILRKESIWLGKTYPMIYLPSSHSCIWLSSFRWMQLKLYKKCPIALPSFMDALYFASKSQPPFTAINNAWKSQDIFQYNWLYSSEKRRSNTHRMAWGWVNRGAIFSFGWNISLKEMTLNENCKKTFKKKLL